MGNKSSKESNLRVENNTFITNETAINSLNETITEKSSNIINKVCQSSYNGAIVKNIINFEGLKVKAKNVKLTQSNEAAITVDAKLTSKIVSQLKTDLTNDITNAIASNTDSNILSELVNKASENIEKGFLSDIMNIGNTSEEVDNTEIINNINVNNSTKVNLQNIVKLVLNNTITNEQSQQCVSNVISQNEAYLKNSEYEVDEDFQLAQSNVVNLYISCVCNSEIISEISDTLATVLQVEVESDNKTSASTSTDNTSEKTEKSEGAGDAAADIAKGVGEGVGTAAKGAGEGISTAAKGAGEGINSAAKGVGEAASSIFSGMTWIFIIIGVVLVAAIIGIVIFLNSGAGQEITKKVADKGLSRFGGACCNSNNTFLSKLINGRK